MTHAAVATIHATALQNNLRRVRQAAPDCPVMAVIKADAYGHGAVEVARALDSADAFAVSRLEEGVELRDAGVKQAIVLFGGFADAVELAAVREYELQPVLHHHDQIGLLAKPGTMAALPVWLKIDTGMGRLGIDPDEVASACQTLADCNGVGRVSLMTHLACADDPDSDATAAQIEDFTAAIGDFRGDISIANSAGILGWPDSVAAAAGRNWVRPGLMLYGASPLQGRAAAELGLQPAMHFTTGLIALRQLKAGRRVGYGGDWQAGRDSVIGIAAVGYADGYKWRLESGTPVAVNGQIAPLAGRVSMDLIAIDLTDLPSVRVGDTVTLWGEQPKVDEIAGCAGTIAYELLAGVGMRVPRRMINP